MSKAIGRSATLRPRPRPPAHSVARCRGSTARGDRHRGRRRPSGRSRDGVRSAPDACAVPHRPGRPARERELGHGPDGHHGDPAVGSGHDGVCSLPNTATATRSSIKIVFSTGTVSEYQWKVGLALPARGPTATARARRHRPAGDERRRPRSAPRRPQVTRRRSPSTSSATGGRSTPRGTTRTRRTSPRRSRPAAHGSRSRSGTTATRRGARRTTATCSRPAPAPARSSDPASGPWPAAASPCSPPWGTTGSAAPRTPTSPHGRRISPWPSSGGRYQNDSVLLLLNGNDAANYGERVVRVRRRPGPVLRARLRVGRHQRRDVRPRTPTTPPPLRARGAGVPVAAERPADPPRRSCKFAFSHYPWYSEATPRRPPTPTCRARPASRDCSASTA